MGRTKKQFNNNSNCLVVEEKETQVGKNKTTWGRGDLDFEGLKKCSEKEFEWLKTDMLVEAVRKYFTVNGYGRDAIVINRIVNILKRRILSHAGIINAHAETIKEKVKRIKAQEETIKQLEDKLKELSQQHTEQLENLSQEHKAKLEQLIQAHATELERLKQEHKGTLKEQNRTFLSNLRKSNAVKSQQESELVRLRQDYALTTQELDKLREELIIKTNLVEEQKKQIQDLSQKLLKLQEELDELKRQRQPSQPTPPPTPPPHTPTPNQINLSQKTHEQPSRENNPKETVGWGFGPNFNENLGGGARRTKKRRRRRSNKTKLGRRLQNRISRRKTLRKRNKN